MKLQKVFLHFNLRLLHLKRTRSYKSLIDEAKAHGYFVIIVFFWLKSHDLAKERVKIRVENGGHNIPVEVIERRYIRGIRNFIQTFQHAADAWTVYDNSDYNPQKIATGIGETIDIKNRDIWNRITNT